jgi:hypothetical protein
MDENKNNSMEPVSSSRRYGGAMSKREVTENRFRSDEKHRERPPVPQSPPRLSQKINSKHNNILFDSQIPLERVPRLYERHNKDAASRSDKFQSSPSSEQVIRHANNKKFTSNAMNCVGDSHHSSLYDLTSKPQHFQNSETELQYYQIVYKGVVALFSDPSAVSEKSGAYVGYGEIIASEKKTYIERFPPGISSQEPRQLFQAQTSVEDPSEASPQKHGETPSVGPSNPVDADTSIIRVDRVLTGGYAVDALDSKVDTVDQTPKRANTQTPVTIISKSPMPIPDHQSNSWNNDEDYHGFIFSSRQNVLIAIPIDVVPKMENGTFLYKVVSSTPLPICTGPSLDAPMTKGMLIPGSSHEVCLRMYNTDSSVCFLRLTRRRGWVADQKVSSKSSGNVRLFCVMQEVTGEENVDNCNVSISSGNTRTAIVATPVSAARRRHRPPRRRRDLKKESHTQPPSHVLGPSQQSHSSSRQGTPNSSFDTSLNDKGLKSPSSNVSLLSDESSQQDQAIKRTASSTPDRSVARSTPSSVVSKKIDFFLMRVNAPRGLKILDAPHFQVNNLIHGNHTVGASAMTPMGMKDLTGQTNNQSIFQTMAGHHTTALTSKIGNPAVFDSIMRARKLPRGSVFEASKRMESSGAFGEGAGLIKLSDNSGWAIVPKQEELDEQYRGRSGSLAGIKEGEATRAFEEVGNASIEERQQPVFLRVHSKGGISISCPAVSSNSSDDGTSPTSPGSSIAGSSAISAGTFSQVTSQDSDIASSVGSSFIDAMFRTPKKKDTDHLSVDSKRIILGNFSNKGPSVDKSPFSTVIPCGMYVEVEPWAEPGELNQHPHRNDFARIRGGQGWIPRFLNGKAVVETIAPPETRIGSFWFRVQHKGGIKVRLGPSRRSPSIKSDDGVYFRFECGEFLRASEIVTFFRDKSPAESFAKLYRNRHLRLQNTYGSVKQLASLTAQSEWVQVFGGEHLYLEECITEPRIERHRQGWRYNVVLDAQIQVRRGPSFEAEQNGVVLLGGESVLVNERVTGPDETMTWLRLKDGQGWVHSVGREGEALMIPHSLKHRKGTLGRQAKAMNGQSDLEYNAIIARLFHNDPVNQEGNTANNLRNGRR